MRIQLAIPAFIFFIVFFLFSIFQLYRLETTTPSTAPVTQSSSQSCPGNNSVTGLLDDAEFYPVTLQIRRYSAWISLTSSLAGFLLSLYCTRLFMRCHNQAEQSPNAFHQAYEELYPQLPLLFKSIIAISGLCILGVLVYEIIFALTYATTGFISLLLLLVFPTAYLTVKFIILKNDQNTHLDDEPELVCGNLIDRNQEPNLWHEVETIAQKIKVIPPDNIMLTLATGFELFLPPIKTPDGKQTHGTTLAIPLLQLAVLDIEEIRFIIAQKLAHLSDKENIYFNNFLIADKIQSGLFYNNGKLFTFLLGIPYIFLTKYLLHNMFDLYSHYNQQNEYNMDRKAASVFSPQIAANTLLRILVIEAFIDKLALQLDNNRILTTNLLKTFIEYINKTEQPDSLTLLKLDREDQDFDLLASIPSVYDRILALPYTIEDQDFNLVASIPSVYDRILALPYTINEQLISRCNRAISVEKTNTINHLITNANEHSKAITNSALEVTKEQNTELVKQMSTGDKIEFSQGYRLFGYIFGITIFLLFWYILYGFSTSFYKGLFMFLLIIPLAIISFLLYIPERKTIFSIKDGYLVSRFLAEKYALSNIEDYHVDGIFSTTIKFKIEKNKPLPQILKRSSYFKITSSNTFRIKIRNIKLNKKTSMDLDDKITIIIHKQICISILRESTAEIDKVTASQ